MKMKIAKGYFAAMGYIATASYTNMVILQIVCICLAFFVFYLATKDVYKYNALKNKGKLIFSIGNIPLQMKKV